MQKIIKSSKVSTLRVFWPYSNKVVSGGGGKADKIDENLFKSKKPKNINKFSKVKKFCKS